MINQKRSLSSTVGTKLVNALQAENIYLPAACGARGACGQCRVSILQGAPPLTAVEAAHISRRQAQDGERLACMVVLREDLDIQVPDELMEVERWQCTVEATRNVTTLMKEIVLRLPAETKIDFEAGNYVMVEAPPHRVSFGDFEIPPAYRAEWERHGLLGLASDCAETTQRAYSLANWPAQADRLVLTVRIALPPHHAPPGTPPGRCSSWLFSVSEGDQVAASGPFGAFRAQDTDREMVLIAGGAGVAPMRSIIYDQLEGRASDRRISFWYGARNRREICYANEWDELLRRHPNFSWQAALSEPEPSDEWTGPTGFIHSVVRSEYLEGHPRPEEVEYYLCGPPLMNLAVVQMLEDLGVDRESIYLDDFGAT